MICLQVLFFLISALPISMFLATLAICSEAKLILNIFNFPSPYNQLGTHDTLPYMV
jgi:hypothetical protein